MLCYVPEILIGRMKVDVESGELTLYTSETDSFPLTYAMNLLDSLNVKSMEGGQVVEWALLIAQTKEYAQDIP